MTSQWLHEWFPMVGMMLQVILWSIIIPHIASPETIAILTFSPLPSDPDF